jgi:hypothetical protein
MAACPRHHFLNLDGTTGPVTPASYGASYCFRSESGTRTVGFSAYGSTPQEALQRLVATVKGLEVQRAA